MRCSLAILSLLAGCKAPPVAPLGADHMVWKSYSLDAEIFAYTGSPMLTIREGFALPTFRMIAMVPIPTGMSRRVPSEDEWVASHRYYGDCGDGEYVVTTPGWYGGLIGFVINAQGVLPCEFAVVEIEKTHFFKKSGRAWTVRDLAGKQVFEPLESRPAPDRTGMASELIYSGQSNGTTFITYPEFAQGDLSRPAFFQDVHYDLQSSKRITFRKWQIEVLEASNDGIRFRVLSD